MDQKHWLLWDGDCAYCARWAVWVQQRDRRGVFRVVPYQQAPSPPMTPALYQACRQGVHVVLNDGEVIAGGRAVLFVLEQLGYRSARWLAHQPLLAVVEWGYRWIAGRRRCSSGTGTNRFL